ncbi:sulfide:quinone oxidoreductase, mitochondrial-like [Phthorimaea operculella]|nr:sulfide:quinone oxidoreductase, mitochondrial-like [Phthorimaea operculella]
MGGVGILKQLPVYSASKNASKLYGTASTTSCIHSCKLLIVGGGTGGCSIAWRFVNKLKPRDIIVLDPAEYHYYQPAFALIGAGIKKHFSRRPTMSVLPPKTCWFRDHCAEFHPENCIVKTQCGDQIKYEYMLVAMGVVNMYDEIPGLRKALDDPKSGVSTIYSPRYCHKTWSCLQRHCGGHAVFTYPYYGGKCPGASQKIMYLADDYWRKRKFRRCTSISYHSGKESIFGVSKYAKALEGIVASRSISTNFCSELVEVKPGEAVFQNGTQTTAIPYTFLHVSPPMCTPEPLRASDLVNSSGYLHVDQYTLQHQKYPNVFGIGDCAGIPNCKTAAAIAPQSRVVEENLTQVMSGKEPTAKYDGYCSCPVLTSYKRGVLTEFKYGKTICETFPWDQSKESRLFYQLPVNYFPRLYWNKLIKGKWDGPAKLRKLINPTGRC